MPSRERWWHKRKAHAELNPPVAVTQEHNNVEPDPHTVPPPELATTETLAQAVMHPTTLLAQATAPTHRLHSVREEAFAAMGLPDIAPPPGKGIITHIDAPHGRTPKPPPLPKPEPTTTPSLNAQLTDIENSVTLANARLSAELRIEQQAAALNQSAQINLALAPQRSYTGKCADLDENEVIQMLERGYLKIEIARHFNIAPSTLLDYLNGDPARLARTQAAVEIAGEAWDAKAAEILRTAPPGGEAKARSIAAFLQWRSEAKTFGYKRKQGLEVSGGLTIHHETPERPPITDLIGEALKAFEPPRRLTDIEDPDTNS
jgi:hypothetical protein